MLSGPGGAAALQLLEVLLQARLNTGADGHQHVPQLVPWQVTGEIGDTWIHGVGSDPGRLAEFRTLLRLRRENVDLADGLAFQKFSRLLLKVRCQRRPCGA